MSGTPTSSGTYTFTLRVTGSHGGYAEKTLTVYIYSSSYAPPLTDGIGLDGAGTFDIGNSNLTKLYVMSNDEFVEVQEFKAEPKQPITLKVGNWVNSEGQEIEVSDIKLRIIADEGEFIDTPEISGEGIFDIPSELVEGELIVSLKALSGDIEIESDSILINADE